MQAELRDLNRYPDRDAVALRTDLADYLGHGLTAANVWAANGSNEVQQQLLQAFAGPGRTALGFGPSYSMHPLLALGTGTRWIGALRDPDFGLTPEAAVAQLDEHDPDLVFLCSPNNPTGTALDPAVITAVLERGARHGDRRRGLRRVRPGRHAERAGPAARPPAAGGHPHDEQGVRVRRRPAGLSRRRPGRGRRRPAGPAAVPPVARSPRPPRARRWRSATPCSPPSRRSRSSATGSSATLRERGFRVADSDANFVLFEVGGDQKIAWQELLDRGVLVRDVGLPGWLRVTAGTPPRPTPS